MTFTRAKSSIENTSGSVFTSHVAMAGIVSLNEGVKQDRLKEAVLNSANALFDNVFLRRRAGDQFLNPFKARVRHLYLSVAAPDLGERVRV